MHTCSECGTANGEGADFCGDCGAYLGWSRSAPATADPGSGGPPAVTEPPARVDEEAAPGVSSADPSAPRGLAAGAPMPGAADTASPAPGREPAGSPAPGAGSPSGPGAAPAPEARPRPEAAADAVPGDDPGAVQPAKPIAPRPVVRPSEVDEAQEGPPCPRCRTPNRSDRRFCRRCAAPLTTTEPAVPLPWWRTRWPFRRRVRFGGSGNAVRRIVMLLVVAALVVAGILLYPLGRNAFEDVRDKLSGPPTEISPSGVSASAAAEGHPAHAACDGLTNRYWGAPGLGASVTFTFHAPFRLVDLIVHTGDSTDPLQFQREARPTSLDLLATAADGTVHEQTVTLGDRPGRQTVETAISDVVRVKLVVRAAAGMAPGRHIALGEVEFFRR